MGIKCVDDALVCCDPDTLYMFFFVLFLDFLQGVCVFVVSEILCVSFFVCVGSCFCFLYFDQFYDIVIFLLSFVRWCDAYTPQNVMHRFGLLQSQTHQQYEKIHYYTVGPASSSQIQRTGVKQPNDMYQTGIVIVLWIGSFKIFFAPKNAVHHLFAVVLYTCVAWRIYTQ